MYYFNFVALHLRNVSGEVSTKCQEKAVLKIPISVLETVLKDSYYT